MNTGQFKLKMLLWEMRFWPVKRGSCLIKEAIKTGLTTCIQVQPVSVPGERGGGVAGGSKHSSFGSSSRKAQEFYV